MLIDWFTVGAQSLNFVILVWLLKRFLYKPILSAIDAREKLIAGKLADADAKEKAARESGDAFKLKNDDFDKQRGALLTKATDDAAEERRKRLEEASRAADTLTAKREETLRSDADSLNQALRRRTQQEVFAIARQTLTDLAGVDLEDRMGEVFTRRLRALEGQAKESFASALKTASGPAVVRSTFDLPEAQRAAIQRTLHETFSTTIEVRFETASTLVGGVELTVNGQKLAWTIADYLAALERGVGELLQERAESKPVSKPQ